MDWIAHVKQREDGTWDCHPLEAHLLSVSTILDEIHDLFLSDDFTSDRALSGESLLAYHRQRAALLRGAGPEADDNQSITE